MPQLILQPFRRFSYVTDHSTALLLLHLRHRHFTYVTVHFQPLRRFIYATAHSTTLLLLHLHHRSFHNPSVASPASQALHVLHLASRPCIGGWKNSLWWTSLLHQVTKFRSSYSVLVAQASMFITHCILWNTLPGPHKTHPRAAGRPRVEDLWCSSFWDINFLINFNMQILKYSKSIRFLSKIFNFLFCRSFRRYRI